MWEQAARPRWRGWAALIRWISRLIEPSRFQSPRGSPSAIRPLAKLAGDHCVFGCVPALVVIAIAAMTLPFRTTSMPALGRRRLLPGLRQRRSKEPGYEKAPEVKGP